MSRLERWSRRKLGEDSRTIDDADIAPVIDENHDEALGADVEAVHQEGGAVDAADSGIEPPAPGSLDATLPDPESLPPGSDIKAFLEPGVSRGLRRRALRRLFAGEKYGIRDGLDDYDHDYREKLKPLASELPQRMRRWTTSSETSPDESDSIDESPYEPIESSPVRDEGASEETEAVEATSTTTNTTQIGDASMLDQGRVGARRQSDQDW